MVVVLLGASRLPALTTERPGDYTRGGREGRQSRFAAAERLCRCFDWWPAAPGGFAGAVLQIRVQSQEDGP